MLALHPLPRELVGLKLVAPPAQNLKISVSCLATPGIRRDVVQLQANIWMSLAVNAAVLAREIVSLQDGRTQFLRDIAPATSGLPLPVGSAPGTPYRASVETPHGLLLVQPSLSSSSVPEEACYQQGK